MKKIRKSLVAVLALLLTFALLPAMALPAAADPESFDPKADDKYWLDEGIRAADYAEKKTSTKTLTIYTAAELGLFAYELDDEGWDLYQGWTVLLGADINLAAHLWWPVSMLETVFDGQGHTISGMLVINVERYDFEMESIPGSVFFAGLFGMLERCEILNLALNNPVVDIDDNLYSVAALGSIAGISFGSQFRNLFIENPTVRLGDALETAFLGGVVGYASDSEELNSANLYAGVINHVEIHGGEVLIANVYMTCLAKYYLGGIAGSNSCSAIVNAMVYYTSIGIEEAEPRTIEEAEARTIDEIYLGGITGYTSAINYPGFGVCVLNSISMASLNVAASITTNASYLGGICGMVDEDAVANTLFISPQDYPLFGDVINTGGYVVDHNHGYSTIGDAHAAKIIDIKNDKTENAGGFWWAAKVTDDDTGYGFENSMKRLIPWTTKTIMGIPDTPWLGVNDTPPTGDNGNMLTWVLVLSALVLGAGCIVVWSRRRSSREI
ncbi:MAG: hypothetical protein FWD43_00735 [Coriobacteriia bacterium]|nr:hypothetical protein [Coriobacteriia bacterium]